MAVHDACDREMAAVIREYRLWAVHYNENTGVRHDSDPQSGSCSVRTELAGISRLRAFNVPKGFGDKRRAAASRKRIEELRRMPPSWRTVRWRITFRQAELKNQLAEVHAMFREEMQQRFTERQGYPCKTRCCILLVLSRTELFKLEIAYRDDTSGGSA